MSTYLVYRKVYLLNKVLNKVIILPIAYCLLPIASVLTELHWFALISRGFEAFLAWRVSGPVGPCGPLWHPVGTESYPLKNMQYGKVHFALQSLQHR